MKKSVGLLTLIVRSNCNVLSTVYNISPTVKHLDVLSKSPKNTLQYIRYKGMASTP